MDIKIETEKKYYCLEPEKLVRVAESLNFKVIQEEYEVDEYFTDINSEFIKNRTCLRIRRHNNDTMEITFKGKSNSLTGQYCKLENNIRVDSNEYDSYINLFSSLGYYSYVEVSKNRITYRLCNNKLIYNIMIDKIPKIGGFVEFEIISDKGQFQVKELKEKLNNFILEFKTVSLKEAVSPYRDIVANSIYETLINKKKIQNLCIGLDCELIRLEKDFFKKYRDSISSIIGYKVKWGGYKNNVSIDENIDCFIKEYFNNLIFDDNSLLVMVELLNKLDINKYFITKVNSKFTEYLFYKLGISYNNILFTKNENVKQKLLRNNLDIKNTIFINEKSLKIVNSYLLILINNYKK